MSQQDLHREALISDLSWLEAYVRCRLGGLEVVAGFEALRIPAGGTGPL
jgi:hypothetical protein